jgi:AcrR family transcriptional regulator
MGDTKKKILLAALRLFAQDGYEAVSVSAIAGELGMTKGALYKHYKNKRDIFDHIVKQVYQEDAQRAIVHGVPEAEYDEMPLAFRNTSMEQFADFIKAAFRIWLEDDLARDFRKMLTIEQHRSPEMAQLYHKCITDYAYVEDLFREMMAQGILKESDPKLLALEFYGTFHFLVDATMADPSADIEEAADYLSAYIERFMDRNSVQKTAGSLSDTETHDRSRNNW